MGSLVRDMFGAVRRRMTRAKVYVQRSLSWLALFNSVMILYLTLSDLAGRNVITGLLKYVVISVAGLAVGLLLFGYFEVKTGFMRAEYQKTWENIPQVREILKRLATIEEKLDDKGKGGHRKNGKI